MGPTTAAREAGHRVRRAEKLAANRPDGHAHPGPFDFNLPRPAAGRDDDRLASQGSAVGLHKQLVVGARNATDTSVFDELCAVTPGAGRERSRQLGGGNEPVSRNQETTEHIARETWLACPRLRGIGSRVRVFQP